MQQETSATADFGPSAETLMAAGRHRRPEGQTPGVLHAGRSAGSSEEGAALQTGR